MFVERRTIVKETNEKTTREPSTPFIVKKLTALWAFNEAVLGGLLHALHIPLTGLFVGGFAAILISLIAFFSESKKDLVKASALVVTAKFLLSPYTPLNAYLSVVFQTGAALLLFNGRKHFTASAVALGISTLVFSALQRVLVYTILFGFTLWESIDKFYVFLLKEFDLGNSALLSVSLSEIIIVGYTAMHLLAGVVVGYFAARLPYRLLKEKRALRNVRFRDAENAEKNAEKPARKKSLAKKFAIKAILLFSVVALALSYFYPEKFGVSHREIILMLVRFVSLLLIWYFLLAPVLKKRISAYAERTQNKYAAELSSIFDDIATAKKIARRSWNGNSDKKFLARIKSFVYQIFSEFLFGDEK